MNGIVTLSGEHRVVAKPLADTAIASLDFADKVSDNNKRDLVFIAELWQGDKRVETCVSYFAPIKHLALTDPKLKVDISLSGNTLTFDVSAQSLALFVGLALEGVDVVFSDNYFDVPAGMSSKVTAPLPTGWTLDQAKKALQVRSLIDSY